MSFTDAPYSFAPSSSRLLGPVDVANSPAYTFNASSTLANDATECSQGKFYYELNPSGTGGDVPPSGAPTTPLVLSVGQTSIVVYFNIAGITGEPDPVYSVLFGTSTTPATPAPAVRASPTLSVYSATITGLTNGTTYYVASVATNPNGQKVSAVSAPITTGGGGGVPSGPPTIPVQATGSPPTNNTITIQFDTTGITNATSYSLLYGATTDPTTPWPVSIQASGIALAAVYGLDENKPYYFKSVASNGTSNVVSAVSAAINTAPNPAGAFVTNFTMTFLTNIGGIWSVDTDGNTACGSLILTGTEAGTISQASGQPDQQESVSQLQSWARIANGRVIVSLGGAAFNVATLIPDTTTANNLADSIAFALFGYAPAGNPLNFSNAAWGGGAEPFFFGGVDIDFEGATNPDVCLALVTRLVNHQYAWKADPAYNTKPYPIISYAPQIPNTWLQAPSSQPWGAWDGTTLTMPFTFSGSALSTINPIYKIGATNSALIGVFPSGRASAADTWFIQCYNNANQDLVTPGSSPATLNPVFVTNMAQWAYLAMISRRAGRSTPKIVFGFATSSVGVSTPVWNATQNMPLLQDAITQINKLVATQLSADGLAPCVPTDWNAGIGFWTSPTAQAAATAAYASGSPLTKTTLGGEVTYLWAEAASPAPNPEWLTAIVDARTA